MKPLDIGEYPGRGPGGMTKEPTAGAGEAESFTPVGEAILPFKSCRGCLFRRSKIRHVGTDRSNRGLPFSNINSKLIDINNSNNSRTCIHCMQDVTS